MKKEVEKRKIENAGEGTGGGGRKERIVGRGGRGGEAGGRG